MLHNPKYELPDLGSIDTDTSHEHPLKSLAKIHTLHTM